MATEETQHQYLPDEISNSLSNQQERNMEPNVDELNRNSVEHIDKYMSLGQIHVDSNLGQTFHE